MSRFLKSSDPSSLASIVDKFFLSIDYYLIWIVAILLVVAISAYVFKQLTIDGSITAFFLGLLIILAFGFGGFGIYIFFIAGAAVLSYLNENNKVYQEAKEIQEKTGRRDAVQVLANGGIGLVLAVLYLFFPNPLIIVMFGASVAEAVSDTFAGEVGMLTRGNTFSVLTGQPMKPGLSGGVSFKGFLASLIGSFLIAVLWYSVYYKPSLSTATFIVLITLAGFFGALIDSILGLTIQAHYYDKEKNKIVEKEFSKGKRLPLARGFRAITNDKVNFLSNLSSVAFASLFYLFMK